jgi:hypothetical protein
MSDSLGTGGNKEVVLYNSAIIPADVKLQIKNNL